MSGAETGTSRRGLGILAWAVGLSLALTHAVDAGGLKYAQRETWLSDLIAFQGSDVHDVDVVILGSSKASFGLSPSAIDICLGETLGRPTQTISLARMFGAAYSFEHLSKDLLGGARKPEVVLLSVEPETFNAYNPQTYMSTPFHADLVDIPALLADATSWDEAAAAGRVLTRGGENLGAYVTGATETEPRLRWLMLFAGGGQWCYGTADCEARNGDFWRTQTSRWDERVETLLPEVRGERFARYVVGEGINHDGMMATIAWARENDVKLAMVDMPMHDIFRAEVPPEMYAMYQTYLHGLAETYDIPLFEGDLPELESDRGVFLDPDHLNPRGAEYFSDLVCDELLVDLLR